MLGKGAIIVVFGFILAFSTFQIKMSSNVLATSDNFTNNYMETLIHETAISAMNMAVNKVWDQDVTADTFSLRQNHCKANVEIGQSGTDTVRVKVVTWGQAYDPEQQNFIANINIEETGLKIELLDRNYYSKLFPILGKYKITKIQEIELSIEDLFLKIVG